MKGDLQLEVNGLVVAPPLAIEKSGKKLTVRGQAAELNLRAGSNRIRVLSNGLSSNLVVIEM
jgi:hypothetical protein